MYIRSKGFTIVELLIVVVVISILATIVIVAYNGIQNRAIEAGMKNDLQGFAKQVENEKTLSGRSTYYPPTSQKLFQAGALSEVRYKYGDTTYFCLEAISTKQSSVLYHINSRNGLAVTNSGACPASTSNAQVQCVAGNGYVSVSQQNDTSEALNITLITDYGTSSTTLVNPGQYKSASSNSRISSVPRGAATLLLEGVSGSTYRSERYFVYEPRTCS